MSSEKDGTLFFWGSLIPSFNSANMDSLLAWKEGKEGGREQGRSHELVRTV